MTAKRGNTDPVALRTGFWIRSARERAGLRQPEVATAVGLSAKSASTVVDWEKGNRLPSMEQLRRLADVLDIPAHILLDPPPTAYEQLDRAVTEADTVPVAEGPTAPAPEEEPVETDVTVYYPESIRAFAELNAKIAANMHALAEIGARMPDVAVQQLAQPLSEIVEAYSRVWRNGAAHGLERAIEKADEALADAPREEKVSS